MKNITILSLTILSLFSFSISAQQAKVTKADKKYDNYAYIDAIKTYERIADKGYETPEMLQKLGNAYFFNSEYEQAAKWYDRLFALNKEVDPVYYYRYAHCLRATGDTKKAAEMLKIYNDKSGITAKASQGGKPINFADKIKENSGRYKVKDAGINTKYSDYGSTFYNSDKLVFTSARDTGSLGQRKHSWTDQYFTNLYEASLSGDSLIPSAPVKFDKGVRSRFHESTAAFTKDGKKMYFTRNNYLEGKKGKDGGNVTLIKIYQAERVNDTWEKVTELPFNSNNYSCAHPALSPDEKTLYFASDMPGTIGASDLYKVSILADGSFGLPQNLGSTINTTGKETFPFVSDDNELYFSSDTHPGLGGLDVFMARITPEGTFEEAENVGDGVNTPKDDFAYLINSKNRIGFVSSNRNGGKGSDDIYQFLETRRLTPPCKPELSGVITELATSQVMPNSKVTLFDENHKAIGSMESDDKGAYIFKNLEFKKTYSVRAEKEDYSTTEKTIALGAEECKYELNLAFEKALCKVAVGDDLGKCFGIKWIYFDLDKSDIRREATLDLAKILDVMAQYPNMKIDIRSHTDSRASNKYNEALSERRAKSTKDWLIKNGIPQNRLSSKGYGETKLVNHCTDGVKCTEEEHQQNRRSEFIITAL